MGKSIILKDYTTYTVDKDHEIDDKSFNSCKKIYESIKQGKYEIIDINGNSIEEPNIFSINPYKKEIQTKGYIGIINVNLPIETKDENGHSEVKYEDIVIKICSRFDHGGKQYFLNYIFSQINKFDVKIFEDMMPEVSAFMNFDILLIIVFLNMIEEATKLDLYREYRTFQYNDSKFKGQLDINRHIKLNPLQNGKIVYSTREYTVDNSINHLILIANDMLEKRHTQLYRNLLKNKSNAKQIINTLKSKVPYYKSLDPRNVLKKATKPIAHPYYYKYEGLRKICILILRRLGYNIFEEIGAQVFGIVIDMPGLWEKFLEESIFNKLGLENKKYNIQDSNKILKLENSFKSESYRREIKPDFTIYDENTGEYNGVFDAKYRAAWGKNVFKKTSDDKWDKGVRNDVFQVLAYMLALNCNIGGTIFPVNTDEKDKGIEKYFISQYVPNKYFYTIPYIVTNYGEENIDYDEFREIMDEQNKEISSRVKEILY